MNLHKYEAILTTIQEQDLHVTTFDQEPSEKRIFLRHDVDYSLEWALTLAQKNHEYGIKAFFGFQLRSPFYNLLSFKAQEIVQKIISLDQDVGLHFVLGKDTTLESIEEDVKQELHILQSHFPQSKPFVSWHNPSLTPGFLESVKALQSKEFVNVYHTTFMDEITYCSDSNMRNSLEEIQKTIQESTKPIHLLLHPIYWCAQGTNVKEILLHTLLQALQEKEFEILNNNTYRKLYPHGLLSTISVEQWNSFLLSR